jgi:predicted transcriptional regulator
MTIQVYTHNDQEEKALLEFLSSRHYDYRETVKEETEEPDAAFLDEYNRELDEGEAQIDAGNYFTQEEVMQYFAERRKKITAN